MEIIIKYLENSDIYREVVINGILKAQNHIFIATANVKDMFVEAGEDFISIVKSFKELCKHGVEIRILHSTVPSRNFLDEIRTARMLKTHNFMMRQCIRCHLKTVIIDGEKVFLGSANFSGAGLGAKRENRRNFELGILSSDIALIDKVTSFFKMIWNGSFCKDCGRKTNCGIRTDNN